MRVILRPTRVNAWSGLGTKKYRNCWEDIGPYFTRSGVRYTGLTRTEAQELGNILNLDLSPNSTFWDSFFIRTVGKDLYLNVEDPFDKLKYLFLKNHKKVKRSLTENKATADFVLINKDEEARRENVFNRIKRDAIKAFDKLSSEDIRKALRLYGHNADRMSAEVAENKLFEIIEGSPQSFMDRWINNTNRELEVLIERAISKNIIRKNKNIYRYGTEVIGHSMGDTVSFLNDPKNQDIKITIMKSLESKETIEPIPEPELPVTPLDDVEKEVLEELINAPVEPVKKTRGRPKKVETVDEEKVKAAAPKSSEDTI